MKYEWMKKEKDRKSAALKIYLLLRKDFIADNPRCKVNKSGCSMVATDVHHKKGRIGSLLTQTEYFLPVCRFCHYWIEIHPKESKELGYSLSRLNK